MKTVLGAVKTSGYLESCINMYIPAEGSMELMMLVHVGHLDFVIIAVQTGRVMHFSF